jgi:hypothetical protein
MLDRSVLFYHEIQRMIAGMATDFAVEGTIIYDLGCSTPRGPDCAFGLTMKPTEWAGLLSNEPSSSAAAGGTPSTKVHASPDARLMQNGQ